MCWHHVNMKVNILKITGDPKRKGEFILHVDDVLLTDLLESSIPKNSGEWKEKSHVMVNVEELKKSVTMEGSLPILVCRHCFMSGYTITEDVILDPIIVSKDGDNIQWEISAPGAGILYEEHTPVKLVFHSKQYEKEIAKI